MRIMGKILFDVNRMIITYLKSHRTDILIV